MLRGLEVKETSAKESLLSNQRWLLIDQSWGDMMRYSDTYCCESRWKKQDGYKGDDTHSCAVPGCRQSDSRLVDGNFLEFSIVTHGERTLLLCVQAVYLEVLALANNRMVCSSRIPFEPVLVCASRGIVPGKKRL